jgi:heat shock protein HtpX
MAMDFYSQISSNKRKTYFLFLAFFILIGFLSFVMSLIVDIFYGVGFVFIFSIFGILTIIFAIVSYYNSDKIVVAVSGAKEAPKAQYKQLHNVVEELCISSGLPAPRVFVINDPAINAFATGRDPKHAVVCVTTGCLKRLNREQLQGVIAHELSHIQNYDVLTMTMATVLVGMAILISDMIFRIFWFSSFSGSRGSSKNGGGVAIVIVLVVGILAAVLTPIIANLIKLSISRKREFMADASAVKMTRNPEGLASALEIISHDSNLLKSANKATAHLYISNPLKGQKMMFKNMFSTHPSIDERINVLRGNKHI